MKTIGKSLILREILDEEASTVSGSGPFEYLIYMLLAQTPASPGGVAITSGEELYGWNILINAAPPVNAFIPASQSMRQTSWLSW
ncbi:MAG: hypothetical protein HEQ35_21295 [Gloeotrichia echinulata IR180]|nr:hypothetical protein [Gloeotrichia echinulata DEX184]